jgi:hypothetical protein
MTPREILHAACDVAYDVIETAALLLLFIVGHIVAAPFNLWFWLRKDGQ